MRYRVIFMEREMAEILESQETMLTHLGKPAPAGDIAKAYLQQVRHAKNWINAQGIPAISVSHRDLIHTSEDAISGLLAFLGSPVPIAALLPVVDPSLHRARSADLR